MLAGPPPGAAASLVPSGAVAFRTSEQARGGSASRNSGFFLGGLADGFGGGATKTKKLAIMKDSHIGTYGVLALVLGIGFKKIGMEMRGY